MSQRLRRKSLAAREVEISAEIACSDPTAAEISAGPLVLMPATTDPERAALLFQFARAD